MMAIAVFKNKKVSRGEAFEGTLLYFIGLLKEIGWDLGGILRDFYCRDFLI